MSIPVCLQVDVDVVVDDVYDGGEEGDPDEDVDDDQNDGAVGCMPDDGTPAQAHRAQSHETKVEAVAIVHVSRPADTQKNIDFSFNLNAHNIMN